MAVIPDNKRAPRPSSPALRAGAALLALSSLFLLLFHFFSGPARAEEGGPEAPEFLLSASAPRALLKDIGFELELKFEGEAEGPVVCEVSGPEGLVRVPCPPGETVSVPITLSEAGRSVVRVQALELDSSRALAGAEVSLRALHGLWTILPPLIAIGLALLFRQVVAALWVSVFLGALILYDFRPLVAIARSIDHYIIGAMADFDHAAMLVFIIFMGGMIGMIARGGGIQGVVELIARRATSPRRGQTATFFMGLFIFFDDYANTIIVGNSMRPISDRLRISREKLSYIVDSTAAPVASIFPISTWIGYEVGLIDSALRMIESADSGYMVFLESIMFRFYPILALALVLMIALTGRDFGPMARAERRARLKGKPLRDGALPMTSLESRKLEPPEGKPRRWFNALIPLVAVILITFIGLWVNGKANLSAAEFEKITTEAADYGLWAKVYMVGQVYSQAAPNIVLAWASLLGCIITVVLVSGQRILSLAEAMQAWLSGVESMVIAIVVLLFAWSLGQVCQDLHTALYLTQSLSGVLSPRALPVITFLLACLISFATGTSYGTMGILIPLVIPIAHELGIEAGLPPADQRLILVGVVSSVLAGSVFGDHCSPISDTTIMSSMACSADHVDHVRTQVPYALLAAAVGVALGDIPAAFGLNPLISIALGIAVLLGVLYLFGSRVDRNKKTGDYEEKGVHGVNQ